MKMIVLYKGLGWRVVINFFIVVWILTTAPSSSDHVYTSSAQIQRLADSEATFIRLFETLLKAYTGSQARVHSIAK